MTASPTDDLASAERRIQELTRELSRATGELAEAREQQAATGEILSVIGSSPRDVQSVFDAIAKNAGKLCGGLFASLFTFDGELLHWVASNIASSSKVLEEMRRLYPTRPTHTHGVGRAVLDRAIVRIPDIEHDPTYQHQSLVRALGTRSGIWVPILREGFPIGVIAVGRPDACLLYTSPSPRD